MFWLGFIVGCLLIGACILAAAWFGPDPLA